MRRLLLALLWAMLPGLLPAAAAEDSAAGEHIARLVARLGSESFVEREEAARTLDTIGAPAVPALRKALVSEDLEVRRRAAQVLRRIETRLETARLLEPRPVRLVYKDTPLAEAVADLARQTGLAVQLGGDKAKLAGRKVSLDTGEVNPWEALQQFCRAAGLTEQLRPPAIEVAQAAEVVAAGRGRVVRVQRYLHGGSTTSYSLVLVDGKPADVPSYLAGAMRLRALAATPQAGKKGGGEVQFALEVACPPHLVWQDLVSVKVHRAVDDKGQALAQPAAVLGGDAGAVRGMEDIIVWDVDQGGIQTPSGCGVQQVPVRFKLGGQPAARLRELHGVLAAYVQSPQEALVTIDNILEAAGKTAQGPDGSFVKVLDAQRLGDGRVQVKVQVRAPENRGGLGPFVARGMRRLVVMNRGGGIDPGTTGLALLGPKGETFRAARAEGQAPALGIDPGGVREYTVTFQAEGTVEPARLVYSGRRSVLIEVPFTLKDIPLAPPPADAAPPAGVK